MARRALQRPKMTNCHISVTKLIRKNRRTRRSWALRDTGASLSSKRSGKGGELLLPGAPRTAGIRFCCPVRPEPRSSFITSVVRPQLCSNRERLVIVGTCGFDRFYGSITPGKNIMLVHTSILVRPHQDRLAESRFWWSRRVLPPGPLRQTLGNLSP